jgi:hypothetical protein
MPWGELLLTSVHPVTLEVALAVRKPMAGDRTMSGNVAQIISS